MQISGLDLRLLEGHRISVALTDGSRVDDCELVAAPRGRSNRLWLCVSGTDRFVPVEAISDIWEPRPTPQKRIA